VSKEGEERRQLGGRGWKVKKQMGLTHSNQKFCLLDLAQSVAMGQSVDQKFAEIGRIRE